MGFALADEAARRGAEVTVVAANVALPAPAGVALRRRRDRRRAAPPPATTRFERLRRAADGRRRRRLPARPPRTPASSRRTRAGAALDAAARAHRGRARRRSPRAGAPGQVLVGFAAEHGEGAVAYGRDKLERKGLDAVVVNDIARPGIGFDADRQRGHDRAATRERAHVPRTAQGRGRAPRSSTTVLSRRSSYRRARCAALMEPHRAAARARRAPRRSRRPAAWPSGSPTTSAAPSKVRDDVLDARDRRAARRGPHPRRGLPGRRQDRAGARARRARSTAQFARVQCTADLLPADIVGTNVYNQREARFEFRPGPIFANVVLVDEINRASPKTQSGLLECMQERHVTVDVHSHELARPFLVFATQNPVEYEGTYPLPEAQVDRFMVRLSLGYPTPRAEAGMLAGHEGGDRVLELEAVADRAEVLGAEDAATRVHASQGAARLHRRAAAPHARRPRVELGASPRAGLMLLRAAKARALRRGPRPRAARRRPGARAARCWRTG